MVKNSKKLAQKLFATALAVSTLVSMTGCSKTNSSASSAPSSNATSYAEKYAKSQEITIDLYSAGANFQGVMTGWYAKVIKDRFNMKINILSPSITGGGDALFQTRCASGNLGDIAVIRKDQINKCYKSGLLYDMTNLLGTDSYVSKTYSKAISSIKTLLNTSKVYGIPAGASTQSCTTPASRNNKPEVGSYLRYDYWTGIGSPKITDTDHLLSVLKQMQDKYPKSESGKKTYGFSFFKDWDSSCMVQALKFCWQYGYTEGYDFALVSPDGKTQAITDDNGIYRKTLKMYYTANQMGLVDPDSVSQNYDTCQAKFDDGQILYSWWPWLTQQFVTTDKANKNIGYTFVPIQDEKLVVDGYNPYGDTTNYVFCVGSKAKDPQRMVDFLNWYGSPEGIEYSYTYTGLKGLVWNLNSSGKPELTAYGVDAPSTNPDVPAEYGGGKYWDCRNQINVYIGNFSDPDPLTGEPYDSQLWSSTLTKNATALDKSWATSFNASNPIDYLKKNSQLSVAAGYDYSVPEYSFDVKQKYAQCGNAIQTASWKMIFAKSQTEFDSLWSNMKTTLTGLGYNDVLAADKKIVNSITDARKKAVSQTGK